MLKEPLQSKENQFEMHFMSVLTLSLNIISAKSRVNFKAQHKKKMFNLTQEYTLRDEHVYQFNGWVLLPNNIKHNFFQ